MSSRCLTPEEYAKEWRISRRTVYRLIKAGKLPAQKKGEQWRILVGHRRTASDNGANPS